MSTPLSRKDATPEEQIEAVASFAQIQATQMMLKFSEMTKKTEEIFRLVDAYGGTNTQEIAKPILDANEKFIRQSIEASFANFPSFTQNIGSVLKIQEKRRCTLGAISYEDILQQIQEDHEFARKVKEADRKMEELISEEEAEKKAAAKTKPQKPSESQKIAVKTRKKEPSQIKAKPIVLTASDLRHQYLMALPKRLSLKEHARVTQRWVTKDVTALREIEDVLPTGEKIKRYAHLPDADIERLRMMHFSPGTEKIFADNLDRKIYTIATTRGLRMVVKLVSKAESFYGFLDFGIGDDKKIFHRCIDPKRDTDLFKTLGQEPEELKLSQQLVSDSSEEWQSLTPYTFDVSEAGVIEVKYPKEEHSLYIYPLRRDLLNRKMFQT